MGEDRSFFLWTNRKAYARAETDAYLKLATKLAMEFDIVPCPHCGWVQLVMVEGLKAQSYLELKSISTISYWGSLSLGGFFLLVACLRKPQPPLYIEIAFCVMALGSGFACGLTYLRRVLLRRCNPNKDFISKVEQATRV